MANNIIVQFSEDEFKTLLKDCIEEGLKNRLLQTSNDSPKRLLSIKEAALFLNLAPQTLYGFTSNRKIPFIKKGKKLYFKTSDLENWLSAGKVNSRAEIIAKISKA